MKSFFKHFFFLYLFFHSAHSYSREIILVENLATTEEGKLLINIIREKFKIPAQMISYRAAVTCEKNSEAVMHLCLQKNGELDVLKVEREIVNTMLRDFYKLGEIQ